MSLVTLIVTLALIGVVVWAVVTYLPMDANIKKLIIVVTMVVLILWLLQLFGLLPGNIGDIKVPKV